MRRYSGLPNNCAGPTRPERLSAERRARRLALYEQVAALHAAGTPKKRIARDVDLSRHTVVAWLAAGHFPERAAHQRPAPTRMDAYAGELAAYYDGGGANAAELARTLRAVGYRGTNTTVRRALALLRGTRPRASTGADASPAPTRTAVPVPSPRQVAWLLRKSEAQLTDDERAYRTALDAACPALAEARTLGDRFVRMLHARDPNDLGPWLTAAATTELRRFAAGIQRDRDAVLAPSASAGATARWKGRTTTSSSSSGVCTVERASRSSERGCSTRPERTKGSPRGSCHDHRMLRRARIARSLTAQIAGIFECDEATVREWTTRSEAEGVGGLRDRPRLGSRPRATPAALGTLAHAMDASPEVVGQAGGVWTAVTLRLYLAVTAHVTLSTGSVRRVLVALGFRWRCPQLALPTPRPSSRTSPRCCLPPRPTRSRSRSTSATSTSCQPCARCGCGSGAKPGS